MVHGLTEARFFKSTAIARGVQMRQTDIMQDVLEADVLISAPKAKSHGSTGISLQPAKTFLPDRRLDSPFENAAAGSHLYTL